MAELSKPGILVLPSTHPSPGIEQARTRKRSIDPLVISAVPLYNAGDRCGPLARTFVEVTAEEVLAEARKKNLLWDFMRKRSRKPVAGQDSIFPCVARLKSHRMSSDMCRLLTHLLLTWLRSRGSGAVAPDQEHAQIEEHRPRL